MEIFRFISSKTIVIGEIIIFSINISLELKKFHLFDYEKTRDNEILKLQCLSLGFLFSRLPMKGTCKTVDIRKAIFSQDY